MLKKGVLVAILVLAFVLNACDGNGGPSEAQAVKPCLEGTWQIVNVETFLRATLPQGAFEPETLKYRGETGSLGYTFNNNGKLVVDALQLVGRFDVRAGIDVYEMKVTIAGFGNGDYTVDGNLINSGKIGEGEINYTAVMGGEEMMNTNNLDEFAPLFVPPYISGRFECSEDTLKLEILNMPGISDPLEFKRVAVE